VEDAMRIALQVAAIGLLILGALGCSESTESGEAAQRGVLAALDSLNRAEKAERPFESAIVAVGNSTVEASFNLECTDRAETLATLLLLGADAGKAFVSTAASPVTTRVITQVDSSAPVDERWLVGGVGDVVAYSPAPVTLGRRMQGAKRVRISFWPYGGDSTMIDLDVSSAAVRLYGVARDCRWPE
jgi:hypothetical protein